MNVLRWKPIVVSAHDYYPFGEYMPGRYVDDTSTKCLISTVSEGVPSVYYTNATLNTSTVLSYGNATVSGTHGIVVTSNSVGAGFSYHISGLKAGVGGSLTLVTTQVGQYLAQVLDNSNGTLIGSTSLAGSGTYPIPFTVSSGDITLRVTLTSPSSGNITPNSLQIAHDTVTAQVIVVSSCNNDFYRFGFNGKLKDNEWAGLGNHLDYGLRPYDPRIGRPPLVDPLFKKYPWFSPYQFFGDNPIRYTDIDGAEPNDPLTRYFTTDAAITITQHPNSAAAKAYGVAAGISGSIGNMVQGGINMIAHPAESAKALGRMLSQTPYQNAADYGVNLSQQYSSPSESFTDYAVKAHVVTDIAAMLLPFKGVTKGSAATEAVAEDAAAVNAGRLPTRLARVVPADVKVETLGRPGEADVFVTDPSAIKGLNSAQIAKKLTIPPAAKGFKIIEFDAPEEGLAQPYNRKNAGFINGGKTAGGAPEYTIPNANISDLKNVKETTVK